MARSARRARLAEVSLRPEPSALVVLFAAACSGETSVVDHDRSEDVGLPALTLSGVSPLEGDVAGGTELRLAGSGFTDSVEVDVGEGRCLELTLVSSAELVCATPAGEPGPVDVTATRLEDAAVATASFTYVDAGGADDGGASDGGGEGSDDGSGGGADSGGGGVDSGGGGVDSGDSGDGDSGVVPVPVDYCHTQWPCSQTVSAGTSSETIYAWVYEVGVTEGAGQGAGISVEVGVGADGSDPSAGGWTWSTATYNVDTDGLSSGDLANDEYQGQVTAPATVGEYDVCARVSVDDGASWTYCDLGGEGCSGSGSDDGYDPSTAASLTSE